ncbi:pyridoxal 5'-phosphate synthase glutaminase subunit PdxT [Candidatus Kaiserbacteria bacterium]|nr:pyridoxal 5'-phosphate synthase glutaminase subunit PdxT [Candidatus Kaiserbacteria bacterium]
MKVLSVGVLAFQGDVEEHVRATENAAKKSKIPVSVRSIRTRDDLHDLSALIMGGGESTTLQKLCEREGMFAQMKKIPNIFGTCAGAILLAKKISHTAEAQRTLALMDIEVKRNAYGRQNDSFEETIETALGFLHAVFVRAPKIIRVGKGVTVLAKNNTGILACEELRRGRYYLATAFHPELTSTLFHEYFLRRVVRHLPRP